TQFDALEVERRSLVELLALVAQRAEERGPSAYRQLATFPNLISNGAIQDLLTALTELENDRSALRLLRSEQNSDVRQLTARINEIEDQLRRLGAEYLEGITRQAASVETALAEIDRELGLLPERQVALLKLLREQKIASEAYVAIERQLRATELMEAVRRETVRVVDAPVAADVDDPQFPKPAVHLVLALVLAAAVAAAVVALRGALLAAG
ncbi:MAG TPA: GNVR domain-containing protein, partial [Gemmatimonadaceae bacterium]|nr:GNVR domain-containing protein [Gemmatimonadaceae bacterium]